MQGIVSLKYKKTIPCICNRFVKKNIYYIFHYLTKCDKILVKLENSMLYHIDILF